MRVDFYVVNGDGEGAGLPIACRLAEKAWQRGHTVYISTAERELARRLDDMLWTFEPEGFVPHALVGQATYREVPILIGDANGPGDEFEVLVNLGPEVPACAERAERIADIVAGDELARERGRERFRRYRERGVEPQSHRV